MYHKPWERQVNESAQCFYAFTIYRDLGPKRRVRAVAERLASEAERDAASEPGTAKPPKDDGERLSMRGSADSTGTIPDKYRKPGAWSHLEIWCTKWGWVDRARAWDDELDRLVRKATVDECELMARTQARECRAAAAVAMWPVARFLQRQAQVPEDIKRLDRIPIEELMVYAIDAGKLLPKLHEGERAARCIRRRDMLADDGTVTTEWEIFERRPDRPDPQLQIGERDETDPL